MCGFESDCSLGFRTLHLLKWSLAEMAQWVKALATKPDSLSLISRTYMVEGENLSLKVVSDRHVLWYLHPLLSTI